MRFKHITVIGLGLIGGSFALAARRAGLADLIAGWDLPGPLEYAREKGLIDAADDSFQSGWQSEADLIYLAAPVEQIADFLRERGRLVAPGAIVTDAGSTKRDVCKAARQGLASGTWFVGGHPMAGSHNSGAEFATPDLFNGAPYAVVVDENMKNEPGADVAISAVREIVLAIGGRPTIMDPYRHDFAVARISHVQQLASTALALSTGKASSEEARELAGSGFWEMTRLAESPWSIWEGICRTNADEIEAALGDLIGELESIRADIQSGNFARLGDAFRKAKEDRI